MGSRAITFPVICGQQSAHEPHCRLVPINIEGGLNLLHEVGDDAVIWLDSTATAALMK